MRIIVKFYAVSIYQERIIKKTILKYGNDYMSVEDRSKITHVDKI